jgi:uncharacterized protein (UPF0548 family)
MFLLTRPAPKKIDAFVEALQALPLSYDPIGLVDRPAPGFAVDEQTAVVGSGAAAFARACDCLRRWTHCSLGWVEIAPRDAPITTGTVVCVLVRHLGFWSMNGCRVVHAIGDSGGREFGFTYGTLSSHAERGEESFTVRLDPDTGYVTYTIRAVSRPRALLAWLGYPVTRRLQAKFRADSVAAMARAVAR